MLDRDFAEKFIDRVTRYTDYNVNIMDERGIIIASRDKARIGQYHEVAYRLVTGTEEIVDTTGMSFPNVLPGINMVIATGGVREGVVGVTGVPDEVRPVALPAAGDGARSGLSGGNGARPDPPKNPAGRGK